MGALGRRSHPIILLCGHKHEFPPPMPRDFDRLLAGAMLKLAHLSLKFPRRRGRHPSSPYF